MKASMFHRVLTALLAMVMVIGLLVPAIAADEPSVSDYSSFLSNLKVLEQYATAYAAGNSGKDAKKLVLNYIRTGVAKYTTSSWQTMAGAEDTGFVEYVAQQDILNGTAVAGLRNLTTFTTPNGQTVEFDHMFGAMDMAYHNANNTDLGSWAGDLSDLLYYSKKGGAGENAGVDAMIADVRENYLGVDEDGVSGFGTLDIYGDLDAYYLVRSIKEGWVLSTAMENYYTAALTDNDRAVYFLNHRFSGVLTQEDVRKAIYDTYCANIGVQMLDAENGITEEDDDLKMACCYAFADYLFELADGRLEGPKDDEGGDDSETGGEEDKPLPDNGYYSVFSSTTSTIAPGISQSVNYAYTADNKQIAYYVSTVDIGRKDVSIHANYNANDPTKGWAMSRVMDQMLAAQNRHTDPAKPDLYVENYSAVLGVNADFFNMSTGKPSGALVMEGVTYNGVGSENFFAILDDGSAVIGAPSQWASYADRVQEAVGGSSFIVKNGENVASKSANYYNNRASRTSVGITAEGKVVLMVLDGRQEPFSCGGALEEIAQIMIDAGCVTAINLDGGGSSTFVSKAEGADELSVVNRPSDGYQRSVSSSLVVVSTAVVSNEFSYATISSDYDYLTNYTSLPLTATGVSISGHSAQIPENAYWQVSNEELGFMDGNVFTACGYGDVEVYLMVDGTIVGSKVLHVVEPDTVAFVNDSVNVIYGTPTEIPFVVTYNGNPVAFNDMEYILFSEQEDAGTFEGNVFTGNEASGIRSSNVGVIFLLAEGEIFAITKVCMYSADEAIFDFNDITAGDRKLAWNREITNTTTEDGNLYQAIDPNGSFDISYAFGLDMEAIEIPHQLSDLTYMLPGSDLEDATAWSFLLQLAERVSVLTEVKVTAQFDADLDVDISEMTVVNEYFELASAELDETTNTLTIIAKWIDQTQAIDPATANPICILSGIKATPKDGAAWDSTNRLAITNVGNVAYDIYLRANQLYSFASKPENQEKFGLYAFENPDVIYNGSPEKGGHFAATYATFSDSFVINKTNRQGWYSNGNNLFYYVDNVAVSGIQALPGYEDPDNIYYYSFEDDGTCNGTITGLFEMDGSTMYAVAGKLRTGWQTVINGAELDYYYFDPATGHAVDGVQTIDGYTYTFTNCVLTRGHLEKNSVGTRYMWAGVWLTREWVNIDGNISYAESDSYFRTGLEYKRDPVTAVVHLYVFDENGVWQKDHTGLYDVDGKTYLVENGYVVEYPGLVKMGDDYYYFNSSHYMVKGRTYWISKSNGYLPCQNYAFDADGKLILDAPVPPTTQPPTTEPKPSEPAQPGVLDGIVKVDANTWYYYKNGIKTYAGLIEIDGDYYYVNSSCKVMHGCKYWISKTNGLVDEMSYTFDADGKMVLPSQNPTTQPSTKPEGTDAPGTTAPLLNGIVKESDSVWYYYVNGVKNYAGLIQIDGDYYYVSSSCKVIHGCTYWISKTNGLLPETRYTFDADGKIVLKQPEPTTKPSTTVPPTTEPPVTEPPLNGIVKESEDVWYYYVNGVKTYAGVFMIGDDYYYAKSNGEVVHGCKYWISKTNGLLPEQKYTFDADGKIVLPKAEPETTVPPTTEPTEPPVTEPPLNGIVKESEDVWYYYVNGVKTYAGVFMIGDDYYYAKSNGEVVHGRSYWISKTNGLLPEQSYTFDAEGKIVL